MARSPETRSSAVESDTIRSIGRARYAVALLALVGLAIGLAAVLFGGTALAAGASTGTGVVESAAGGAAVAASVPIQQAPVASLTADPENPAVGEEVTFDASESADRDGEIIFYGWDFNSNGTFDDRTQVPTNTHTYDSPGEYDATVVVYDDDQNGARDNVTISVGQDGPVATCTVSSTNVEPGEEVTIDASDSANADWIEFDFDAVDLAGVALESPDEAEPIHVFDGTGPARLGPGESIRVYTGYPPGDGIAGGDGDDERAWAERTASVWADATAVDVRDPDAVDDPSDEANGLLARKLLERPDADGSYALSTAVPPHWFPFTMDYDEDDPPTIDDPDADYRLQLSLLLDAETIDSSLGDLPRPEGTILSPADGSALRLFEEEVTRSGREVSRRYQHARWTDGSTHLWSGRRSTLGAGELASGLRFDVLEDS